MSTYEPANVGDPLAYSDVWSVAPGDTIKFMVCTNAVSYQASLVRLHGNGPECEEVQPSEIDGEYPGRRQFTRVGSCVVVNGLSDIEPPASVTASLWVWPTRLRTGREQVLMTGGSWTLFLDESGRAGFRVASGGEQVTTSVGEPLIERTWVFAIGTYDAVNGILSIRCHEQGLWARPRPAAHRHVPVRPLDPPTEPAIMIAGDPSGNHFDGKLEEPTVYSRALNDAELAELTRTRHDKRFPKTGLIAAWRFHYEMDSGRVVDTGPRRLHGILVNRPTRAMTGHRWSAKSHDPALAPEEYGAIHFHGDNVGDAGWDCDFELSIPDTFASGVYAIRLLTVTGGSDTVPFVVRPPRRRKSSRVALVLPTMTYLAYANERPVSEYQSHRRTTPHKLTPWDAWLDRHPEFGISLYDTHLDGSGCCYSSRLRPIPSLRPDYEHSQLKFPRHLPADLFLIQWLDSIDVTVDILTDEDVDRDGIDVLGDYTVVLTGSHPEYVSANIFDTVQEYISGGGRLMYLGGNGFFWVTSLGRPREHFIEVRRGQTNELPWDSNPGELHHSSTGELGGLWELRGRLARSLLAVGTAAMGLHAHPYVRTAESFNPRYSWVFAGLAEDEAISAPGYAFGDAGGHEIDRCDVSRGSPASAVVLARAEGSHREFELFSPGSVFDKKAPVGAPPLARADLTLLTNCNGGAVFSVGSMAWVGCLMVNKGDNPVSIVTRNVLTNFLAGDIPF